MATTISPATLVVTLTEAITLSGVVQGATNVLSITSVTEISKRIVNIPTTEVEIIAFAATNPAAGTFVEADVRYIRITNLDDTNHVTLTFKNEDLDEFAVKLDKGQSFIYNGDLAGGVVNTFDADSGALTVSLADLVNITALADTAACDLEIFVAGT